MVKEIIRTYRYRLKPTEEQTKLLCQFAGSCRYVYNRAIAEHHIDDIPEKIMYNSLSKWLTSLKNKPDLSWLYEVSSQSLQCALKDLTQACKKVSKERKLGKEAHVHFRSRSDGLGSIRFPQNIRLKNIWGTYKLKTFVVLPKIGDIEYISSRTILDNAKIAQATICEECNKWYISIVVKETLDIPDIKDKSISSIDLGVRNFAVVYNGVKETFYNVPDIVKKKLCYLDKRIKFLQAISSAKIERKAFGSAYRKLCSKIRKLWLKIRRIRLDFLHKLTTLMAESQCHFAVENLKIQKVTSNDGNYKKNLNRSILEQGWYLFRVLLKYKLERYGRNLIEVNPAYTSMTCSSCGNCSKSNRNGEHFYCSICGYKDHADVNASKNIWAAGRAVL